ncbi:MAG: hypothetical protein HKP61_12630 [Dactylosporangium sp.]|nr:hypothetical protein [Dactylosporangium sp.]NNJ61764.1 hypothetical protein [Dactylosporangium sp.]
MEPGRFTSRVRPPPPSYDELRAENAALRAMVADLTTRLEQAITALRWLHRLVADVAATG